MADEQVVAARRGRRSATSRTAGAPVVRLAQLVRSPATMPAAAATIDAALVIEVGGARVTVARGVDLGMLSVVLAMLGSGGRQ